MTLYETTENHSRPTCYLWNETIAARGGQEIASCLFKHFFGELKKETEIGYLDSDCCPGKNRNIYKTIMFLEVVKIFQSKGRKLTINYKFLQPESRFYPCIIEKP